MNFRDIAEQNENWIIEQRRYFHAHPELSFEEKNTTHEIGKCLEEMGLTPHYYPDYNGLWANPIMGVQQMAAQMSLVISFFIIDRKSTRLNSSHSV